MPRSTAPLRIIQYGLGPIGQACAQAVLEKEKTGRVQLVGAIDIDPEKAGRDVGELLESGEPSGVTVSDDASATLADARPDVVLHTTTSFLEDVQPQLLQCLRAGVPVVSSTEELAYPYERHPERAAQLDEAAKENGVALVGTGVNPGYAMDALALMATGPCVEVASVSVERVVDAGARRAPLQRKVGAGIDVETFRERKATGTFGHIGLRESLYMVAGGLGWTLGRAEETLEPVLAEHALATPILEVAAGAVAGIDHRITGYMEGEAVLSLALQMYVGAEAPRDAVRVEGDPPIDLVVRGGIFGDTATVAALVNAAALVAEAQPGLRTMSDLPVPRAFATRRAAVSAGAA